MIRKVQVIPIREDGGGFYREPTLEKLLADPVIMAVMQADAVSPERLEAMLRNIADVLRKAPRAGAMAAARQGRYEHVSKTPIRA